MADLTLSELTERAETAKAIEDPTARRIELRAIFGAVTNYRLAAIEQHLGIAHEGLDDLHSQLQLPAVDGAVSGPASGSRRRRPGDSKPL